MKTEVIPAVDGESGTIKNGMVRMLESAQIRGRCNVYEQNERLEWLMP